MIESANSWQSVNRLPELTQRQSQVLELVVRQYTETATPVSSKSLARQAVLDVSAATIRNDLARLEELGLLTHPHTSAGRVPTNMGYRYFIERMMPERPLPLAERRHIQHQFHQLGLELTQWLQLSAVVLADTVRNATLVTAPRAPQVHFKHLELVATHGNAVLLVLVLEDGTVRQQGLLTRQTLSQEVLSNISDRLSAMCRGLVASEIEALLGSELNALEREVMKLVAACMREIDDSAVVEAYHEGLRHLFAQPEFHDGASISQAMRLLETEWLAAEILPQVLAADGVTVIIGGSSKTLDLRGYGLVLSRYGVRHNLVGALGVLGPTRMQYDRVIPAVRYVAGLLNDLLWSLFGPGEESQPPSLR